MEQELINELNELREYKKKVQGICNICTISSVRKCYELADEVTELKRVINEYTGSKCQQK